MNIHAQSLAPLSGKLAVTRKCQAGPRARQQEDWMEELCANALDRDWIDGERWVKTYFIMIVNAISACLNTWGSLLITSGVVA